MAMTRPTRTLAVVARIIGRAVLPTTTPFHIATGARNPPAKTAGRALVVRRNPSPISGSRVHSRSKGRRRTFAYFSNPASL